MAEVKLDIPGILSMPMDRRSLLKIGGYAAIGAGLAACGFGTQSSSGKGSLAGKRVGVCVPLYLPVYIQQYKWFKAEAALPGNGQQILFLDAARGTQNYSEQQNIQDFETFIAEHVDAVIMDFANPCLWLDATARARKAGISVWGNSEHPLTGATQNQLNPLFEGGQGVGQAAAKWVNARGGNASVGVIRRPDNPPVDQISLGFIDGLTKAAPGAKVVAQGTGFQQSTVAASVANMYEAHRDITVWYAEEINNAVAALTPLREAGATDPDKVFVAASDTSPDGLQLIQSGTSPLQATISFVKSTFAAVELMRQVEKSLRGEAVKPTMVTHGIVVTKDNAAQLQTWLNDLLAPGVEAEYAKVVTYSDQVLTTPNCT